jgi:5-methylthioadenosine/S-adenosylhomocysteine deaminase
MTTQPEACDLLIEAGFVVPVEPHGVVLENHALAVRDGVILELARSTRRASATRPGKPYRVPMAALIPGWSMRHTHNPMTLLRGVADDLPLMEWLQGHIWPIEGAVIGPEFVADGIALAIAEMLRGGTTCANENYFFPTCRPRSTSSTASVPAWACRSSISRLRGQIRRRILRSRHRSARPVAPRSARRHYLRAARAVHGERCELRAHPHAGRPARRAGAPAYARNRARSAESHEKLGQRPLARLDRLGLVNDRLIAVHMTQLTDAEIALCAQRGVSVVHCPESNLKLASGFCPVGKLQKAGVNIAIGTDGCASNNDLDMFGETRTAALLAKAVAEDASAFDAASALHAATLGGARALGFEAQVGSIVPGKQADLACVDLVSWKPSRCTT